MWTLCFKVLDDIKGSVRNAAAELSRVLIGILIRTLEADSTSSTDSRKMLENVLPFLFSHSGLESSAQEVQASSLHTLLEIIKKAKAITLRPFIPGLVENILGLLTGLESAAVNYVYLNAAKYNIKEHEIDSIRLSSIRNGPLMEGIERCLDGLDEGSMAELSVKLLSAMKAAVGVPSKVCGIGSLKLLHSYLPFRQVGCALVLVSLSTRRLILFRPHADTFLKAIPKYLSDRNDTVLQSYAASLGYVARGASDGALLKVSGTAKGLYFDSDDDKSRLTAGEIVRAVAKHSTDRFTALASEFLPFVFLARHDENAGVKRLFEEVWNDNTGGPRAATLYLDEIVTLVLRHLSSPRWIVKHAAALAIASATEALSASQGRISEAEARMLWPALKQALADKTWEGKEKVLDGLVTFAQKAPTGSLGLDGEIAKVRPMGDGSCECVCRWAQATRVCSNRGWGWWWWWCLRPSET